MPGFEKNPAKYLEIAVVSDRSDGKLAHLDGLNFSRAWCLFEMGRALNNQKMIDLGERHFNYSYEKMDSGEYAGAHWLASFALYAASPNLSKGEEKEKERMKNEIEQQWKNLITNQSSEKYWPTRLLRSVFTCACERFIQKPFFWKAPIIMATKMRIRLSALVR